MIKYEKETQTLVIDNMEIISHGGYEVDVPSVPIVIEHWRITNNFILGGTLKYPTKIMKLLIRFRIIPAMHRYVEPLSRKQIEIARELK